MNKDSIFIGCHRGKQKDVAEKMGVSPMAVSQALRFQTVSLLARRIRTYVMNCADGYCVVI